LAWYAFAAMAAMAFMVSLLLLIALGTPPEYRMWVLGGVSILLLATAAYCAMHARQQLTRDSALIGDFTKGLRLDLAMVNLALKDPQTHDADRLAARERARTEVRDAAAAAPSTTEMEMPHSPVTPPAEMTASAPPAQSGDERPPHGTT
jgi:hypothetical protein